MLRDISDLRGTSGKYLEQYNIYLVILLQAMVAKFSSISTRKLSKALTILTCDKKMVATSDYDDFHKLVKRCIITNLLGAGAQVQYFFVILLTPSCIEELLY